MAFILFFESQSRTRVRKYWSEPLPILQQSYWRTSSQFILWFDCALWQAYWFDCVVVCVLVQEWYGDRIETIYVIHTNILFWTLYYLLVKPFLSLFAKSNQLIVVETSEGEQSVNLVTDQVELFHNINRLADLFWCRQVISFEVKFSVNTLLQLSL
jgi:hypothetical protein